MTQPEITRAGKITVAVLVSAGLLTWVIGGSMLDRGGDGDVSPAPRMAALELSGVPPAATVDPLPQIQVPPLRPVQAPKPG